MRFLDGQALAASHSKSLVDKIVNQDSVIAGESSLPQLTCRVTLYGPPVS